MLGSVYGLQLLLINKVKTQEGINGIVRYLYLFQTKACLQTLCPLQVIIC